MNNEMTSREAVALALAHRDGRVPIDFGGSPVSGLHVSVAAALQEYYGLGREPVRVIEPYQMLGEVTDALRGAMRIDTLGLESRNTLFGYPNTGPWREWRAPWGQLVLVPAQFQTRREPNGDVVIFPEGDTGAPPSGHMPASGYFFDTIVRQDPVNKEALNPDDNLEEFTAFSGEDTAYWKERAEQARVSRLGVIANMGGTGFGDIALVPAPFLKHPKGIRDISEWYVSLVTRTAYVHAIFERQCAAALDNLSRFHSIMGDSIDVLYVCGTDFGTQISQFCSPATFDEIYMPYYRQVNDWVHRRTRWKTMKHTCGAVDPLMPNLIRAGFDILNPVQCSAVGMEPRRLKETYGRDIVFWGGGVDTQKTLPFGTPEQVRAEVLERCRVFSPGGGFVFNAIHNIQARTPVANVVAMLDAVTEFNNAGG
jgi:hypothetical protein